MYIPSPQNSKYRNFNVQILSIDRGGFKEGGARGHAPQTMDEKLKLSCRAHILVLQLPLMTIKQLINIAV